MCVSAFVSTDLMHLHASGMRRLMGVAAPVVFGLGERGERSAAAAERRGSAYSTQITARGRVKQSVPNPRTLRRHERKRIWRKWGVCVQR